MDGKNGTFMTSISNSRVHFYSRIIGLYGNLSSIIDQSQIRKRTKLALSDEFKTILARMLGTNVNSEQCNSSTLRL